jgi:hypothetical protein
MDVDTVPVNLFIPIGAIVAALVAGLFSFFNLVLSKEQKLSELRQDWIDGLRNDLAEHIAAIQAIGYLHGIYHHTPEGQVNM